MEIKNQATLLWKSGCKRREREAPAGSMDRHETMRLRVEQVAADKHRLPSLLSLVPRGCDGNGRAEYDTGITNDVSQTEDRGGEGNEDLIAVVMRV